MSNYFNQLVQSYKQLHPSFSHANVQAHIHKYYNSIKNEENVEEIVTAKVQSWDRLHMKRKAGKISYWYDAVKQKKKKEPTDNNSDPSNANQSSPSAESSSNSSTINSNDFSNKIASSSDTSSNATTSSETSTEAPRKSHSVAKTKKRYAEESLNSQLLELTHDIQKLEKVLEMKVIANTSETKEALKVKQEAVQNILKEKHLLERNRINQKNTRERKKVKGTAKPGTGSNNTVDETSSSVKATLGRPHKHDEQELIKTITKIAISGSSADPRRRTDVINSVKTLDDLHSELCKLGYDLSRSAVYLRLKPRRVDSIEGKRHKTIANVKLCRAQPMERSQNEDRWFAATTMKHVEDFAILMGSKNVAILGKDDKALIPLGIPAANKQSPLLMCMEYPVRLPDHTFVVSTKHKLILSVYASREIKGDSLSYSGPTHVAIRSLKHDKADAFAGFDDLMDVISLPHFEPYLKHDGKLKPIWVFTRDGHDGPRFPSTRQALIKLFQTKDIDYIIAVCNASGLSAYHFIERRMAPLSKELAGVILPHDHFGSHLKCKWSDRRPGVRDEKFQEGSRSIKRHLVFD